MVTYPIRIKRNSYRRNDMRKKLKAAEENRTAVALELHINGQILSQQEPIRTFMYGYIASDTGYPES